MDSGHWQHPAPTLRAAAEGITPKRATSQRATPEERRAAGKALRERVPRPTHAAWTAQSKRSDVIALLHAADATPIPELVPIRYADQAERDHAALKAAMRAGRLAVEMER